MNTVPSSKQLAALYPSMSRSTRICVVGAGPSGLSAALTLTKLGYKNVTVLDQHSKVGGMCGSEVVEGRVYDLGGQVIAKESSPALVSLMNELGVELEEMGDTLSRIDCATGKMEEMKIVADCVSLLPVTSKLQAKSSATGRIGIHAVSSLAHELAPQYLKSNGFEKGVPGVVAALFTASGYGYPQDLPYAYFHEFVRSCLGQAWRVKGGYSSFWQTVANLLPDVRCNVQVKRIRRSQELVQISFVDSSSSSPNQPNFRPEKTLEFDKIVLSGSVSIPRGNRVYRSSSSSISSECKKQTGILDYTDEELELFSKVETMDYYTTVLKISGLDIPAMFYYPEHADDPSNMGHFVAMQRFYAETDIFLFWSYGTAEVQKNRVTELLYEDVGRMGGHVEALILQRKWCYFPHVRNPDMAAGFYDRLSELQGKHNTYYTGALMAFELTERNSMFSMALMRRCFGSPNEVLFVKRLIERPIGAEKEIDYKPKEPTELPGLEFPDLHTTDAYVSFYANHPVTRDRVVYTWLDSQGKESHKLTYAELDKRATVIARHLLLTSTKPATLRPGDRVVLLHPPGLEFIEAFLGCLRARILAVPLIPPDPTKGGGDQALEKLANVVKITDARAILSTRAYHNVVRASSLSLVRKARLRWPKLPWIHTNCLPDNYSGEAMSKSWMPVAALMGMKEVVSGITSFELNSDRPASNLHADLSGFKDGADQLPGYEAGILPEKTEEAVTHDTAEVIQGLQDMDGSSIASGTVEGGSPDLDEVCFLQFTSGSTGDAKGVMITHGALIHNVKSMRAAYKGTSRSVVVSWLPQYHDMGLIGGLLVSMVTGGSLVIFSPITFIRKPMIWLETVEKYRATHTAAPNFGFELVLKRSQMLEASGRGKKLDLSSLRFLMVGAEPISSQTMRGFVETFRDAGVKEQSFAPGYGMAENCVFICCAFGRNRPMLMDSQGRVCCGYTDRSRGNGVISGSHPQSRTWHGEFKDSCSDVRIVNPESLEEVKDAEEGEIWLSSPSNGVGYWGMPDATKQTFGVHLNGASQDDAQIKFLRSGDLGRVIQGNLFVTGRIKDLIIVNGRNYYPSDIEKTVENCSLSLRPGCSAAFSASAKVLRSVGIPTGDASSEEAGIVVVVEVRDETKLKKGAADLLAAQIKAVVAEEHGVQVVAVNLLKPRTIPKTTSGKIRRRECLKRFSENTLSIVKGSANLGVKRAYARLHRQPQQTFSRSGPKYFQTQVPGTGVKGKGEITTFLVQVVADITGMAASTISVSESFENYSIDSQGAVAAASKLSEFLDTPISAIQIYTTGCISELVDFCSDIVKKENPKVPHSPSLGSLDHSAPILGTSIEQQSLTYNIREYEDGVEEMSEAQLAQALEPSAARQILITALQVLGILYIGALLILPAVCIYEKLIQIVVSNDHSTSQSKIALLSTALVPLAWILYIGIIGPMLSVFGARTLLPINHKSHTTTIPLWSLGYVRWWTLYRLQDFSSSALAAHLRGTVFLTYWYRLLGADIENGVYLDTVDITDPSLLSIGTGATVGEGATIQSHEVNGGVVRFQAVSIGRGCVVGPYAVLQRGSVMDAGSSISALQKTEVRERVSTPAQPASQVKNTSTLALAIGQLFGIYLVGLTSTVSSVIAYAIFLRIASHDRMQIVTDLSLRNAARQYANYGYLISPLAMTFPRYLVILAPLLLFPEPTLLPQLLMDIAKQRRVVSLLCNCGVAFVMYGATLSVLTCILKWSLVGRVQGGSSSNQGFKYRLWLVHALLRSAHEKFMGQLMGTEALCMYLRSLGAKVGRMVSIRRLNVMVDPDLLHLGEECHLGDFSKIITSQNLPGGLVSSGPLAVGNRCLVGAQSVVMPGSTLHQSAVLGAMSVAPSGSVLEEGGVYVGINSPVRIYQQHASDSTRRETSSSIPEEKAEKVNRNPEEEEHPLLAGAAAIDPRFRQMIASTAAEFVKNTPAGHARYIHYLGSAGKGVMRVLDNLPVGLFRHDIFTPGATYPIIFRCSNGVSKHDDRCADVRGGTLRVLQPESPQELHTPLLDLFMKTGRTFHARNMVEFLSYYIMTEEERKERIKQFPALGESQWGNLRKPNSYTELHYYGCTARIFRALPTSEPSVPPASNEGKEPLQKKAGLETGPEAAVEMYVKFKLRPIDCRFGEDEGSVEPNGELPPLSGMLPPSDDDTRSKAFLREDFKSRLQSPEGVKYILQLQLHPIPASKKEREEVQDPTKVWDEKEFPYMDAAELWLNEHLEDAVFDDIHFNPKYGPPSLTMINATSALQAASIDQGRSLLHDLLGYLRSGAPLPSLWHDLVKKSFPAASAVERKESEHLLAKAPGCPMMAGKSNGTANPESLKLSDHGQHQNSPKSTVISHDHHKNTIANLKAPPMDVLQSINLTFLRLLQPILQVVAPIALLLLALYPSLMALGLVGAKAGKQWMYGLLPLAYLCTGLLFAALSICCKWAVSWKIRDSDAHQLWSPATLRHTVWDVINQTLASTFLELGKGSVLCTLYLKGLGASIKDTSLYVDTLHALNPDQVRLGSRSAIGRNALLFGHLYEGEQVGFKSNFVGDDTFIGTRALLLPGLKMEDGAQLPVLGLGMKDEVIRADFL